MLVDFDVFEMCVKPLQVIVQVLFDPLWKLQGCGFFLFFAQSEQVFQQLNTGEEARDVGGGEGEIVFA